MIDIADKMACCGCAACESACPVGCINVVVDNEGFSYPSVDYDACIECRLCEQACPFLAPIGKAPVMGVFAAKTLDKRLLHESSSAGIFTELCKPTIGAGGAVYGVAMDADCRGCSFVRAEELDGIASMRGSKYLQADSRGVYERVAADLKMGRKVLFSGTPCQANALSLYLGGRREGLLIVDFVCHGVPSPRLWSESVDALEAKRGARVKSVNFRCKELSWRRFGLRAELGETAVFQPLDESPYLRMFLSDVCLRESCYACRAKDARVADVTVADFWGIEDVLPEMSDELGCSLVIARTKAGLGAVEGIADAIERREVGYGEAVRSNPAVHKSAARPPERDAFFGDLDARGYEWVAREYGSVSAKERSKKLAKRALSKMGLVEVARKLRGGGVVRE